MLLLSLLACVAEDPSPSGLEVVLRVHDPERSEIAAEKVLLTAFDVEGQDSWAVLIDGEGRTEWWVQGSADRRLVRAHPGRDGRSVVIVENDVLGDRESGVITRYPLDGAPPTVTPAPQAHHDLLELDGAFAFLEHTYDHLVLVGEQQERAVAADAVRVVAEGSHEEGEVLFDFFADYPIEPWWVCDHMSAEDGFLPGYNEWTHSNSLVRHPTDDAYLVLARYLDAILKIDATTGEVLWQLGGRDSDFALGPGAAFVHAHFSHAWDDRLLIFDNGDKHGGRGDTSRVVELVVDEESRTAEVAWELEDPRGKHTIFLGDARRLPGGNTLVAFSHQNRITELTPSGEAVWEIEVPDLAIGRVTVWPR